MSEDGIIPAGKFKISCPHCGAELGIERDGIELKGNERLICPVHGDQMSLEEARRTVFEQNRDDIVDKAKRLIRDRFGEGRK